MRTKSNVVNRDSQEADGAERRRKRHPLWLVHRDRLDNDSTFFYLSHGSSPGGAQKVGAQRSGWAGGNSGVDPGRLSTGSSKKPARPAGEKNLSRLKPATGEA